MSNRCPVCRYKICTPFKNLAHGWKHGENFCAFEFFDGWHCANCGHLADNGFKHVRDGACRYTAFLGGYTRVFQVSSHLSMFETRRYEEWKRHQTLHIRQMTFEALVVKRLFREKQFAKWFVSVYIDRPCKKRDYDNIVSFQETKRDVGYIIGIIVVVLMVAYISYHLKSSSS